MNRRDFIRTSLAGATLAALPRNLWSADPAPAKRPNIVFVVADDMGWRDTGYQGSPNIKTPCLDALVENGVRFDYFYAAAQMCSPGRFGILTGRTPYRSGVIALTPMRPQEITIAQTLKAAGYSTGHFGKWHLGGRETGPKWMGFERAIYSDNYYDNGATLFVDNTKKKRMHNGATLFVDDTKETVQLPKDQDSSVATMDLALEWMKPQAQAGKPFFAYVCFGSPHGPEKGAEEFKKLYTKGKIDYYAEVSGLDAAVGKLRAALREWKVADDTLVWFVSDNGGCGPETLEPNGLHKMDIGCRTAGCLEWPARFPKPIRTNIPAVHMDMYPTALAAAGVNLPDHRPIDGMDILPLLDGKVKEREKPIGFILFEPKAPTKSPPVDCVNGTQGIWIDGSLKLIVAQADRETDNRPIHRNRPGLYDIHADPKDSKDLSAAMPERVTVMRVALDRWRQSVRDSFDGKDYPNGVKGNP
jgi:arylsulfatase A-like enzyme